MEYKQLFSPITLGKLEIKNRLAMAPMGTDLAHPVRLWGDEEIAYFAERAKGGVGLIISPFTAATSVLSDILRGRPLMAINSDDQIPSHKRMTDAVHKAGGKMFVQCAIFGGKFGEATPVSMHSPNFASRPRELTLDEIWRIIADFGQAARRAREAGYDGVEIHGCHGYLIGQFISPAMNKRTDEFGGSFEARMKFPVEIFRAMRKQAGDDFPLGFKMSAWEDIEGGIRGGAESIAVVKRMADEGIAYAHVGTLNTTVERLSPYPSVPCMYVPRNTLVPLAAEIKEALPGITVMATGSIIVPDEAEQFLQEGKCDMFALGRTLLAEPHWVNKAQKGENYRPCIRCNVCHHQLWFAEPLICTVNPYLLKEAQEPIQPTSRKKKVTVVGGGPGGINAALVASARGHDVTLYEGRPYLGGMLYPGSRPDCKAEVRLLLAHYERALKESKVTVKTGVEVTLAMVQAQKPDALVLAVGSIPAAPDIPGIKQSHVVTAIDALRDRGIVTGQHVVVIGGGDVGCETACHLADAGKEVTIVEILPALMTEQYINNVKMQMYSLLDRKGVKYYTSSQVTQIDEKTLEVKGPAGWWTLPAESVVVATGSRPAVDMRETLRLGCAEVHIVGDCAKMGRIREAVLEGDRAGRLI